MTKRHARAKGVTGKHTEEKPAFRPGRPSREFAGQVDTRILDAAERVFRQKGLAGASIDEIARLAPVSKPTLYARFPRKEELFTAVLSRKVKANIALLGSDSSCGSTIEDRLIQLGIAVARQVLTEDTVASLRLAIAEAQRFPELAKSIEKEVRVTFAETIEKVLAEVAQSKELGASHALAADQLDSTALFFADLTLLPLLIRALLGEKLESVRAKISPHVASCVPVFLMACRESCLEGWHGNWDDD